MATSGGQLDSVTPRDTATRRVVHSSRARAARHHQGLPVRPGRRADPDRRGAQRGLEGDVRRVPPAARRRRRASRSCRSTPAPTTTATSTAGRAPTASAPSSPRAASPCPRARPDDPPDADTVNGIGNRKNVLVLQTIREDGVEVYRGLGGLPARGHGTPGCAAPSSRPAPTARDVLEAAGIDRPHRGARRRRGRPRRGPAGKPAPGHVPAPAPSCLGVAPGRGAPSSRTPWPASRPAAPAASGIVVGVDRVGQADGAAANGADIVVHDLSEL